MGSLTFGVLFSILLSLVKDRTMVRLVAMGYTIFMSPFMPFLDNWVASSCIGSRRAIMAISGCGSL